MSSYGRHTLGVIYEKSVCLCKIRRTFHFHHCVSRKNGIFDLSIDRKVAAVGTDFFI